MTIKKGQIIKIEFDGREFEAIVIDPNGLGRNRPSVGFGFGMMERHGGLPKQTLSNWLTEESGFEGVPNNAIKLLKLPSNKALKVSQILGLDNNEYLVLEVSEWIILATDVVKNPGKVRKGVRDKLVDFLGWFAVKGFCADAYTQLKDKYTQADSRAISAWMEARLKGVNHRNRYTEFLQEQGCKESYEFANWTDCIYKGLFGIKAKDMLKIWSLVEGDKSISRNYIPESQGLEAVAYCENQVIELFYQDLEQAHKDAIAFTQRKFKL